MSDLEVSKAIAAKLERTSNWRVRQELGTLAETMSREIVPFATQLEERRWCDAADYLLAAYGSAQDLIRIMDRAFPEISEMPD